MSNRRLPEFGLTSCDYGWSAHLPVGSPRLFGREISLEIHTGTIPNDTPTLPPVSESQEALVRSLIPMLPSLVQRVEKELLAYHKKLDPQLPSVIRHPHIWLDSEDDDGCSWTFVIERADSPDFGYHAEFKGTEFVELWAGD